MSHININNTGGTGGPGTVTSFSFTNANGFIGTVTNPTTIPNLTLLSAFTITGNTGVATQSAGNWNLNTAGTTVQFVGSGSTITQNFNISNILFGVAGNTLTTGAGNVSIGQLALQFVTSGTNNVAIGVNALNANTNANLNIAIGAQALEKFNPGGTSTTTQNIAIGGSCLLNLIRGTSNIAIGVDAGFSYTGSESGNIIIGNAGTLGESNIIRIGDSGAQTECFIAGISGVTVTGTAVLCSASGQLGTISSSERYKENISPISDEISVLHLVPVEFNYKVDLTKSKKYGLIAEHVHHDFPYLCYYNEENQPESVKYHELCTFLLHEIRKMDMRIRYLEGWRA